MAKLEESGRLLSARTAHNVTPVHVDDIQAALQPVNDMTGSFCHVAKMNYHLSDSDSDAANEMQNLLGGELPPQLPGYHFVNRPLGCILSIKLFQYMQQF